MSPLRVPLTDAQEDLLAHARTTGIEAAIGSVTSAVRIAGPLDMGWLTAALHDLTRRHEALRLLFVPEDGGIEVTVADEREPELALCRAVGASLGQRELDARRLAAAERAQPADAMHGPSLRALVIRVDDDDHVLALSAHRLVCDTESVRILMAELGALYIARSLRRPHVLQPLPLSYTAYCAWTRERWAVNQRYWNEVLKGAQTPPTARGGERVESHFTLPADLIGLERAHHATTLELLAACWAATLAEVTGAGELLIATDLSGRCRPEHGPLVGALTQRVHLRIDTGGSRHFGELLSRVKPVVRRAAAHRFHASHRLRSALPFPYGLRWLGPHSTPTGIPAAWRSFPLPLRAVDTCAASLTAEPRPDGTIAATVLGDRTSAAAITERLQKTVSAIATGHEHT